MPTQPGRPDSGPLACRLVPVEDGRQHSIVERYPGPESRPRGGKPRTRRNPLLADVVDVRVENVSSTDVDLLADDPSRPFSSSIFIEDEGGHPVLFPHYGPSSLKRLGLAPPAARTVNLKPGRGVSVEARIWSRLNPRDVPKAGKYFARAVVSFYRASDGRDCRVESPRMTLTIEEDEIREYLDVFRRIEASGVVPVDEPE